MAIVTRLTAEKTDATQELQAQIETLLRPIADEFTERILEYYQTLEVCGYGATILTSILRQKLPGHQTRIGYGHRLGAKERYHYWTEVDDVVFVDGTGEQFNDDIYDMVAQNRILIGKIESLRCLGFARLDRSHPERYVPPYGTRQVVDELCAHPDSPCTPCWETIVSEENRRYTHDTILDLLEKIS